MNSLPPWAVFILLPLAVFPVLWLARAVSRAISKIVIARRAAHKVSTRKVGSSSTGGRPESDGAADSLVSRGISPADDPDGPLGHRARQRDQADRARSQKEEAQSALQELLRHRVHARAVLEQQGDLTSALKRLEAEIAKRGLTDHSSPRVGVADAGPGKSGEPLARLEAREYRVWFGTNREIVVQDHPSWGISSGRGGGVSYGHCDVLVPESHKTGSTGSSWWRRLVVRDDDRLRVTRTRVLDQGDYWRAIAKQLAEKSPGARHAVVFIHGYNVTFEQAAIRAAQIGFDLGVDGAMGFFSWPSQGSVGQYLADGAAIEASEPAIADFLADFGRNTGADFVHVIAHSMGNRGLLRAANRIFADAERRTGCRFGQFILAAPDVDADTFRALAGAYQMAKRTTLYVSARDRAVELSRWIHDYPRVGFEPPISIFDGIDTVSVTNVDLTLLGHGYVGEARPVLADMHNLIFRGDPPEARFALEPREADGGGRYWVVRG